MGVEVVVTDENGKPLHCSVAAVRTSDQSIISLVDTDTEGKATLGVAGTWFPRPMVAPEYKSRVKMTILNNRNAAIYDYVVDSTGGGTHLTVRAMMADFIAAAEAATTVRKSCWVARDDTDTNIEWGSETNIRAAVLLIEGAGAAANRTFLSYPGDTNGDAYFKTNHRYTPTIVYRGLRVGGGLSTNDGAFMSDTFVGSASNVTFSNCELAGALINNRNPIMLMVGQASLPTLTFENCTGSASALLSNAAISFKYLVVHDCRLTLNQLVIGNTAPVLRISGGELTLSTSGFNPTSGNASETWNISDIDVYYTGSGTCFSKASGQTAASVVYLSNIRFQATNAAAKAFDFSGSGFATDSLFADSIYMVGTGGAGPAFTVGANMDNVYLGDISGINWATVLSGGTSYAAPAGADYLVGTSQGGLSAEIVVGTAPGGELGGTWASPTVAATHSGSVHHAQSHASRHAQGGADALDVADLGSGAAASGTIPQADGAGGVAWVAGGGAAIVPFLHDSAVSVWTNMPAAKTELFGVTTHRTKVDLTNVTGVTFVVNVQTAGVAGSKLRVEYSTDESTWAALQATGNAPEVAIDATGVKTAAATIDAGAKANVFLRVVGISGDGATDPAFGSVALIAGGASGGGGGGGGAPTTAKYVTTASDGTLSAERVHEHLNDFCPEDLNAWATASTMDDEFDDTTGNSGSGNGLNARWTWQSQGISTFTYAKQGYGYGTGIAAGAWGPYLYQTAPSGDWTFEAEFSNDSRAGCGLIAVDTTASKNYVQLLYQKVSGVVYTTVLLGMRLGAAWGWEATFNGEPPVPNRCWLRYNYTSATKVMRIFWSADGVGWQEIPGFTSTNAITRIGFFVVGTAYIGHFRKVA